MSGWGAAPSPPKTRPLVLALGQDSQFTPNIVAVHPLGRRVYLGARYNTNPDRLNLTVYTVNEKGETVGEPRRYRDSALPLPTQARTSITALQADARHKKLFIGYSLDGKGGGDEKRFLSVYDLDDNGEPIGAARSYDVGNPNKSLLGLALNPKQDVLYLVGWGSSAVYCYQLNDKGEPEGEPKAFPVGGQGKFEIAISPDAKRLYLGTYPDVLEVLDLDGNGFPTGKARTFKAGAEKTYLRFAYSPHALFLRRTTPEGARLGLWPLDADGNPSGDPQVRPDLPASTLAVDSSRRKLWVGADDTFQDAFSGKTIVQGVRPVSFLIKDDGSLGESNHDFPAGFREQGIAMAADEGQAVLVTSTMPRGVLGNRVKDYRARVTLLAAKQDSGAAPAKVAFQIKPFRGGNAVKWEPVTIGESTMWGNLDGMLKDELGPILANVSGARNLVEMKLRIEIAEGDPVAGGKLLKTMTDEVLGSNMLVLLPGYGFDPPQQREAAIESFTDHAQKYLDAARAVGLKPEDRPRLFNVSGHQLLGGQGSVTQLQRQAETVALLGFNTINAYWWGAIPPAKVDEVLDGVGLSHRTSAIYNPPSYFAYDTEKMNPAELEKWAQQFPEGVAKNNGGTPADVVTHYLADEPGWYYPSRLDEVRNNPQRLENFRAYLREKGLQPQDLGKASWSEVLPLGASEGAEEGAPLTTRRLYYWTTRFYPESSARGFRLATDAIRKIYGHAVDTPVNWNNWQSDWYHPSPNAKIANNPIVGPDSAYGSMDWFENGRQSSNTLWSEDWFGDSSAQNWSYYCDLLRSAAMLGQERFGGYVIGASVGGFSSGAKYKILSLLGHGGKSLDMFTFGPEPLFPGNCWSEGLYKYKPIADAMRLVGRSERVLYPGKPARGKVAVLVPTASRLWEHQARQTYYQGELGGLHFALIHAGYTVDFVDDIDLSGNDWSKRDYTTLYITGPNIKAAAQEKIVSWVRGGGMLVATPGAGTADEYNTPTQLLDGVLGVQNRVAVRDAERTPSASATPTDVFVGKDARFGTGNFDLEGPVVKLEITTAAPLALLKSGGAAITGNVFGKGRGLAYAFFPGRQYELSADRSDRSRLPVGWSAVARQFTVAPVQVAGTSRPVVVSTSGVEACRLQSATGIAITLLNWTAEPQGNLTVTIPEIGKFRKVTAASGAQVKSAFNGDTLTVTLPLKDVDVLIVE
jgi:hypothetical protein